MSLSPLSLSHLPLSLSFALPPSSPVHAAGQVGFGQVGAGGGVRGVVRQAGYVGVLDLRGAGGGRKGRLWVSW